MQKQTQPPPQKIIKDFILEFASMNFENSAEEDKFIEKFVVNRIVPLGNKEDCILQAIKQILTDPEINHPRKYVPLLYISLINVESDNVSDLFKFYYELTSHAIRELKEDKHSISPTYWEAILEKIYQYGMLLLIGSRSILLNVESLGMRVNSQLFFVKAKEMRLSRLVKIYNCILCIPQKFLTLKQTLYLTLIFTRWQLQQNSLFTPTFFANFTLKTQKKLIRKLRNYPEHLFNQEHILNLIKIVLGGDELVFSFYLQIKYTYEALKLDASSNFKTDKSVFQSLKKCPVIRENRHLFNFIIQLLVNLRSEEVLNKVERESILFVCLKYLSGKFENNEHLYIILVRHLLHESNSIISQMCFRFIREEALQFLTAHKLKLLLNVFNVQNWTSILRESSAEEGIVLGKLERVLSLLGGMARRYSQSSLVLYCSPSQYGLSIKQAKNVKSLILVVSFDGVGRLNESQALEMKVLKLLVGKQSYEIHFNFAENIESLKLQATLQPKQRLASLIIKHNNKELINERKQYLRYAEGCFQSLIAISVNEKTNTLAFCIDGAYFQFQNRKGEFTQIQVGCMSGSIRTFYAMKIEIELINFYKTWCQRNRKAKYVVEGLGTHNIVYKMNNREDLVIVDTNKSSGFSFFQSKTQIKVSALPAKQITFIDILLQLGGLETIFFIMERFSRSLIQFRNCQEKINALIADFFNFLKTVGVLDQSNALLNDIYNCFKYLNEFLFLLIKRNRIVRESRNSNLLMSIFELLIYFRQCKKHHISQPLQQKMTNIQTTLILKTLVNFQIWSHCSISLQLFVLSEIEFYIKENVHSEKLVREDLHKELLSGLVLFQTSDKRIAHYPQVQAKMVLLCILLYQNAKGYIVTSPNQSNYSTFVERDISTSFAFLKFLLGNCKSRKFSESEKSAFKLLVKYIIDNFISKKFFFEMVGKVWNSLLNILCASLNEVEIIDRQIVEGGGFLIVHVASQEEGFDIWILRYLQNLLNSNASNFHDCFYVLSRMMGKFLFATQRKHTIINRIFIGLKDKLRSQKWGFEQAKQFKGLLSGINPLSLYNLSNQPQFLELYLLLETKCLAPESEEQEEIVLQKNENWRLINLTILQILYKEKKITNTNAKFITTLMSHLQSSPMQIFTNRSLSSISEKLIELKEQAKQSHKNSNNQFIKHDIRSAFALIEHCCNWNTMQFLMKNGLLTIQNDLCIPFDFQETSEELSSIGGTVGYYLSRNPSPLQLFILFNVILYRQLSNNLTILTTQANLAIFQYSIEYLIDCDRLPAALHEDSLWLDIATLVIVLKEVMKLLNNSFINKTASVYKDIDRLLGTLSVKKGETVSWKNKKSIQILQNLSKASEKIQASLQDTKIDKDMSAFIDLISCKLTLIHQKDEKDEIISIVSNLMEDLKTKNWVVHEQQFKKLSILGIKFFKVSREYYLAKHSEHLFDQSLERKVNQKIPQVTQKEAEQFSNYWNSVIEKFDNILEEFNDRGKVSEQVWENLLITNEHWFDLQGDLNDITTKFYELDEKETGPFGFYKLNIRPVRSDHEKLPYPRKKEYSEMRSKKEKLEKEKEESMVSQRLTIQFANTTLFSTLAESVPINKERSTMRLTEKLQIEQKNMKQKEYYCEYVTKRGVYAGTISKKRHSIEFRFTGYDDFPKEREYQTSTNKCHRIQNLSEWEEKEIRVMKIRLNGSKIFSRRYIMRHTAFELFHNVKHRSYFFNLFFKDQLKAFLADLRTANVEIIDRRSQEFARAGYTEKWIKGELSNFQYLGLINRYSGRTTNDLAQYLILPWVIANYNGQNNYKEIDKQFYKNTQNLRDLSLPTGKLNNEKFVKLKARLREVDASDREIRFLYGTMYSNPTVLYNFFIRLEPFTSLHWEHQGRKIDHADRLFSGIFQQFNTILTSSSDMKELAPEFYYWTEFLRNRNRIDLGRKQKGDDVDAVVLPVWSRTPEQFIFKMREALESKYVSQHLHQWIDLIFGYKAPLSVAQQHDNLYHYQCYEHDLFTDYQTENEMKIAQIAISEFGSIPQQIFYKQHPKRNTRKDMSIDMGIIIHKQSNIIGFQQNEAGIMLWNDESVIFKKVAITGLYNSFEWTKVLQNKNKFCVLTSINFMKVIGLSRGVLRVMQKGRVKMQKSIESKYFDVMGNYIFYSSGSKIVILEISGEMFEEYNTLYGHRDEVILIKTDFILDVIVSVDRSGYVLIHELTELRFLRAFQLGVNFEKEQTEKLRLCIHRMGYYIFLDHDQTLWIFNYMGELILQQDIEVRTADTKQDEQRIGEIEIYSHEHSLLLFSSSKGNIFLVNFLDIVRFKEIYPFKTFSRLGRNILDGVRSKTAETLSGKAIKQFSLIKTVGEKSAIYQLLVLYETNELVCYTEERQMGEQLQTNVRLKSMGFF